MRKVTMDGLPHLLRLRFLPVLLICLFAYSAFGQLTQTPLEHSSNSAFHHETVGNVYDVMCIDTKEKTIVFRKNRIEFFMKNALPQVSLFYQLPFEAANIEIEGIGLRSSYTISNPNKDMADVLNNPNINISQYEKIVYKQNGLIIATISIRDGQFLIDSKLGLTYSESNWILPTAEYTVQDREIFVENRKLLSFSNNTKSRSDKQLAFSFEK